MTAVIIKDTIEVNIAYADVYRVSAIVTESTREVGKQVSVLWNSGSGATALSNQLIEAYNSLPTNQITVITEQVKNAIGTQFTEIDPEEVLDSQIVINASNVTVNGGT